MVEGAVLNISRQCANLTVPRDYLSQDNVTTQVGVAKGTPEELRYPLGGYISTLADQVRRKSLWDEGQFWCGIEVRDW
jgi:hypothetical protein